MIIQCPACGQRANLPDSKEGAKVRCGECGRVYVARPPGAKRSSRQDPTRYVVIGAVAVVVLGFALWLKNQPEPVRTVQAEEEPEAPPPPPAPATGWDSPLVQRARALHEAAFEGDDARLQDLLDGNAIWLRSNAAPDTAPGPVRPAPVAEGTRDWLVLSAVEQQQVVEAAIADLLEGESHALVADWKPWDGNVVAEEDRWAVVRVRVASREDESLPDRHVEWRLRREGTRWRAWSWERWIDPDEEPERGPSRKKTVKRTLSDGSSVIESAVRDLGHLEETPAELRAEIDGLLEQLVDIDARPAVRTRAHDRLYEIGRPAIPPLLSMIARIPLETEDQAIQLQQVHVLLTDMTGYVTTYKPHVALGATEERQDSGLKQWFGWYDRKFRRYTGPQQPELEEDPLLDGFQPRNAQEAREIEKARRELERSGGGG